MFNMGFIELVVLGVIALVVIGPKQLPEMARVIARMLNEFKRATGDITKTFSDVKSKAQDSFLDVQNEVTQATDSVKQQTPKMDELDHLASLEPSKDKADE